MPKFRPGDRVVANERAPQDYAGRAGTVIEKLEDRAEYRVAFLDDPLGPASLYSWWLDRVA